MELAKLAATVMWRNGVPLAVRASRWSRRLTRWKCCWRSVTLEIGEVVELTVEVVKETDQMEVLLEICDAGVSQRDSS